MLAGLLVWSMTPSQRVPSWRTFGKGSQHVTGPDQ
jgi:hypothetical protein